MITAFEFGHEIVNSEILCFKKCSTFVKSNINWLKAFMTKHCMCKYNIDCILESCTKKTKDKIHFLKYNEYDCKICV